MRVLDLFCGLKGFSRPFADRGHEVITLDIDNTFDPDIVADVRVIRYPSLSLSGRFDAILASPPCAAFSRVRAWRGWPPELERDGLALVSNTFRLIAEIVPTWWIVENPAGRLKRYIGPPTQMIHLCDYGSKFQKPPDLWGRWPIELPVPNPCAPHEISRSGKVGMKNDAFLRQTFGFTAKGKALRAKLPYGLGENLCKQMEAASD